MGSLAFTLGLGVKMSLLLALPAVGVVLWLGAGRDRALKQAVLMGQVQVSSFSLCVLREGFGVELERRD